MATKRARDLVLSDIVTIDGERLRIACMWRGHTEGMVGFTFRGDQGGPRIRYLHGDDEVTIG